MKIEPNTLETANILHALDRWTRQRPGLDFRNYGDVAAYRAELRTITRDLADFRALAVAVGTLDPAKIDWQDAFRAYSGRLSWDGQRLDYCTGQYWPTEYRKAACAALASVLWDYARENYKPAPVAWCVYQWGSASRAIQYGTREDAEAALRADGGPSWGCISELYRFGPKLLTAGNWMRAHFRNRFGRGIASRWFN